MQSRIIILAAIALAGCTSMEGDTEGYDIEASITTAAADVALSDFSQPVQEWLRELLPNISNEPAVVDFWSASRADSVRGEVQMHLDVPVQGDFTFKMGHENQVYNLHFISSTG